MVWPMRRRGRRARNREVWTLEALIVVKLLAGFSLVSWHPRPHGALALSAPWSGWHSAGLAGSVDGDDQDFPLFSLVPAIPYRYRTRRCAEPCEHDHP